MSQDWKPRQAPPRRIDVGDGLVLRAWETADVDDLTDAVMASIDELKPWMPWAHGFDRDSAAGFIEGRGPAREERTDFTYGIFEHGEVRGSTGLHARIGPGRLEIGYWVHTAHTGRGIARRAAAALVGAAFALDDVEAVEIRHHPDNARSGRIPEALGFRCLGVLPIVSTDEGDDRTATTVWELTRGAFAGRAGRRS